MSFYVVVEGKDDEAQMKKLEAAQRTDAEEETSHIAIKSALENIQQLHNKAKIIQWERQQSLGQDIFRMEATLRKSVLAMNCVKYTMNQKIIQIVIRLYI